MNAADHHGCVKMVVSEYSVYIKNKYRENGTNRIKFSVQYVNDNERFWGALTLLTKG